MNKFQRLDEMNMLPNREIKVEQQNSNRKHQNRKRNSIVEEKKKDKCPYKQVLSHGMKLFHLDLAVSQAHKLCSAVPEYLKSTQELR